MVIFEFPNLKLFKNSMQPIAKIFFIFMIM